MYKDWHTRTYRKVGTLENTYIQRNETNTYNGMKIHGYKIDRFYDKS